jgi:hypothetical protein
MVTETVSLYVPADTSCPAGIRPYIVETHVLFLVTLLDTADVPPVPSPQITDIEESIKRL